MAGDGGGGGSKYFRLFIPSYKHAYKNVRNENLSVSEWFYILHILLFSRHSHFTSSVEMCVAVHFQHLLYSWSKQIAEHVKSTHAASIILMKCKNKPASTSSEMVLRQVAKST